jgi:hypothetical protein
LGIGGGSIYYFSLSVELQRLPTYKLTLLRWYRQYRFLPHTAPELDRHVVLAAQSVPAVPDKQMLEPG